jgi:hypothetical protein
MKVKKFEEKIEKLSEMNEKILHYAGKMMQCVEELSDEDYGERDDDDDDDEYMERGYRRSSRGGYDGGMRRRRDSRGRYM